VNAWNTQLRTACETHGWTYVDYRDAALGFLRNSMICSSLNLFFTSDFPSPGVDSKPKRPFQLLVAHKRR
jgi:hypothetical protein